MIDTNVHTQLEQARLETARAIVAYQGHRIDEVDRHLASAIATLATISHALKTSNSWELPTELAWHRGQDGTWWIIDPNSDDTLRLVNDCHRGPLLDRPDAALLTDLLHRRNAAERRRPNAVVTSTTPRDWNIELAVLGHWHWSPPTRLHGWWAVPTNPHSAFDVVPLRDVTTLWEKRAREAHPIVAKLVDERDAAERGR